MLVYTLSSLHFPHLFPCSLDFMYLIHLQSQMGSISSKQTFVHLLHHPSCIFHVLPFLKVPFKLLSHSSCQKGATTHEVFLRNGGSCFHTSCWNLFSQRDHWLFLHFLFFSLLWCLNFRNLVYFPTLLSFNKSSLIFEPSFFSFSEIFFLIYSDFLL